MAPAGVVRARGHLALSSTACASSRRVVFAAAGSTDVKIAIEGMMCDGCSSRIEDVLKVRSLCMRVR